MVRHVTARRLPRISQLRFALRVVSANERNRLITSVIIFVVALTLILARGYWSGTIVVPEPGGSYTEGLIGNPRFINPLLAAGNDADRDITSLVFAGLFRADGSGAIVPDLASQFKISDDRTEYTVELKNGLEWHDGEPLTADDVLFTLQLMQNPELKSPLKWLSTGLGATKLDARTLTFKLKEPAADFPQFFTVGIIPQHLWEAIPVAMAYRAEANTRPIGAGPYLFKKLTRDTQGVIHSMVLERNKNYHGETPFIDEIIFKFYPDTETALSALKNKNVEGLGFVPLQYQQELTSISWLTVHSLDLPQYRALFFNPHKNEVLKDRAVRRAIAKAVDRDTIVNEALAGSAVSIVSPLLPELTPTSTVAALAGYNPDEAIALLDGAGWKLTEGSPVRKKDDKELSLTITAVDQPELRAVASLLQGNLASVGFSMRVNYIPRGEIKKSIIEPRNYEALLFGQITASPQDLYAFWHSSQTAHPGNNLTIIANKDIDAAVDGIRSAADAGQQQAYFEALTEKLAFEGFATFLYTPMYLYPVHSKIKGIKQLQTVAAPSDRFASIATWYIRTKREKS